MGKFNIRPGEVFTRKTLNRLKPTQNGIRTPQRAVEEPLTGVIQYPVRYIGSNYIGTIKLNNKDYKPDNNGNYQYDIALAYLSRLEVNTSSVPTNLQYELLPYGMTVNVRRAYKTLYVKNDDLNAGIYLFTTSNFFGNGAYLPENKYAIVDFGDVPTDQHILDVHGNPVEEGDHQQFAAVPVDLPNGLVYPPGTYTAMRIANAGIIVTGANIPVIPPVLI